MTAPERDKRMIDAATRMRAAHGPGHARHSMWAAMAGLLERLAELAPFWHEPYAAPFVPIIEAGVRVATSYDDAVTTTAHTHQRAADVVAQAIRVVDGDHTKGAGALGECAVAALRQAGFLRDDAAPGSGRRHGEVPQGGVERELYDATHGETAWDEIAALPVARLIRWYRTLPGCEMGGSLHIVLDDLNCDDHHVQWCSGYAGGLGDTCGSELAGLLKQMPVYERVHAVMLANGESVNGVRFTDA